MATNVGALVTALRSGDPAQQQAAAEELARLGEDAQPAAVALVEACAGGDELREWATAALESLGPPASKDVPALASLLEQGSLDVAYWAATLLGRAHADAASAVANLTRALEGHPEMGVRQRAAWALGQIGPAAKGALAALDAAAAESDARLASLARAATAQVRG